MTSITLSNSVLTVSIESSIIELDTLLADWATVTVEQDNDIDIIVATWVTSDGYCIPVAWWANDSFHTASTNTITLTLNPRSVGTAIVSLYSYYQNNKTFASNNPTEATLRLYTLSSSSTYDGANIGSDFTIRIGYETDSSTWDKLTTSNTTLWVTTNGLTHDIFFSESIVVNLDTYMETGTVILDRESDCEYNGNMVNITDSLTFDTRGEHTIHIKKTNANYYGYSIIALRAANKAGGTSYGENIGHFYIICRLKDYASISASPLKVNCKNSDTSTATLSITAAPSNMVINNFSDNFTSYLTVNDKNQSTITKNNIEYLYKVYTLGPKNTTDDYIVETITGTFDNVFFVATSTTVSVNIQYYVGNNEGIVFDSPQEFEYPVTTTSFQFTPATNSQNLSINYNITSGNTSMFSINNNTITVNNGVAGTYNLTVNATCIKSINSGTVSYIYNNDWNIEDISIYCNGQAIEQTTLNIGDANYEAWPVYQNTTVYIVLSGGHAFNQISINDVILYCNGDITSDTGIQPGRYITKYVVPIGTQNLPLTVQEVSVGILMAMKYSTKIYIWVDTTALTDFSNYHAVVTLYNLPNSVIMYNNSPYNNNKIYCPISNYDSDELLYISSNEPIHTADINVKIYYNNTQILCGMVGYGWSYYDPYYAQTYVKNFDNVTDTIYSEINLTIDDTEFMTRHDYFYVKLTEETISNHTHVTVNDSSYKNADGFSSFDINKTLDDEIYSAVSNFTVTLTTIIRILQVVPKIYDYTGSSQYPYITSSVAGTVIYSFDSGFSTSYNIAISNEQVDTEVKLSSISKVNPGTYTIYCKYSDDTTSTIYESLGTVTGSMTINKIIVSPTTTLYDTTYNGYSQLIAHIETGYSDCSFSVQIVYTPNIGSASTTTNTYTGSCDITGIYAGKYDISIQINDGQSEYLETKYKSQGTSTICKCPGTITITTSDYTYDANSHIIATASASQADGSTLNYELISGNSEYDYVTSAGDSNNSLSATNARVYYIYYILSSDNTNNNYEGTGEPTYSDKTATINQASLTITAASASKTYDGAALVYPNGVTGDTKYFSVSGLVSGHYINSIYILGSQTAIGDSKNIPTIDNNHPISILNASNINVESNYNINCINGTLTVTNKQTCSYTITQTSLVYNDEYQDISLYVTCDNCYISGGDTLKKNVGNYSFIITAENGYQFSNGDNAKTQSWSITKASQNIQVSVVENLIYNGSLQKIAEVTNYYGTPYIGTSKSDLTTSRSELYVIRQGTYNIYVKIIGDTNHFDYTSSLAEKSISISKLSISIQSDSDSKIYDGSPLENHNITNNGLISGHTIHLDSEEWASITDIGTVDNSFVLNSIEDSAYNEVTDNYNITKHYGTLTITRYKTSIFYINKTSFEYNGSSQGPTITATGCHYKSGTTSATNPGSYTITYEADSDYMFKNEDDNYSSTKSLSWTITKLKITDDMITTVISNHVYNGQYQTIASVTTSYGDVYLGVSTTVSKTNTLSKINTGTYNIYMKIIGKTGYENVDTKLIGKATIRKAPLTLTTASDTKVYDGTALTNPNVTKDGLISGHTAYFVANGSQTEVGTSNNTLNTNSGSYWIKNGTAYVTSNYSWTNNIVLGTLTVNTNNRASYSFNQYMFTYDGTTKNPGLTLTNCEYESGNVAAVGADTYIILLSSEEGYTFSDGDTSCEAYWKINKADSTIFINTPTNIIYNGSAQTIATTTVTGGTGYMGLTSSNLTHTATLTSINAGNYTIYYKVVGNINYNDVTQTSTTNTINKRTITITSNSTSKTYDGASISCATFTVSNLVSGHTCNCSSWQSFTTVGEHTNTFTLTNITDSSGNDVTSNYTETLIYGTVNIIARQLATANLDTTEYTWTGAKITPTVTYSNCTYTGDTYAINSKNTSSETSPHKYTITCTANTGYEFEDGNTTKTLDWYIISPPDISTTITASLTSSTLYYTSSEQTLATLTSVRTGVYSSCCGDLRWVINTEPDYTSGTTSSSPISTTTNSTIKKTNAGIYYIWIRYIQSYMSGGDNTTLCYKLIGSISINKKALTITAASTSRTYNDTVLTYPNTTTFNTNYFTVEGLAKSDNVHIHVNIDGSIKEVGSTTNTPSNPKVYKNYPHGTNSYGDTYKGYYSITSINYSNITAADAVVVPSGEAILYDYNDKSVIVYNPTSDRNIVSKLTSYIDTISQDLSFNIGSAIYSSTGVSWVTAGDEVDVTDNYTFTMVSGTLTVTQASLHSIENLSSSEYEYTGNEIKPNSVVYGYKKGVLTALTSDIEYTLKYENNINVGTATVTATGKGNFTGSLQTTFKIIVYSRIYVGNNKVKQVYKGSTESKKVYKGSTIIFNKN